MNEGKSLEAALSRDRVRAGIEERLKGERAFFQNIERTAVSIREGNAMGFAQSKGVPEGLAASYAHAMFDANASEADKGKAREEMRAALSNDSAADEIESLTANLVGAAQAEVQGARGAFGNAIAKDKQMLIEAGYDAAKVEEFLQEWGLAEYVK